MRRKIAIYGGTFDPLHIGHIKIADAAASECGLDKVVFMPDRVSPFKEYRLTTEGTDRFQMVKCAIKHNPAFTVSCYELYKEGPSYTIETLEFWKKISSAEISFVLGLDSVLEVDTWKRGADILRNFPLITAKRPGTEDDVGMKKIESLRAEYSANITVLDMEPVDVSATEIRRRIKSGLGISDMVTPEVEEYIIEHNLYR